MQINYVDQLCRSIIQCREIEQQCGKKTRSAFFSWFRIRGFESLVQTPRFQLPGFESLVQIPWFQLPAVWLPLGLDPWLRIPGFNFLVSDSRFRIFGFVFMVSNLWFRIHGIGYLFQNLWFPITGFSFLQFGIPSFESSFSQLSALQDKYL